MQKSIKQEIFYNANPLEKTNTDKMGFPVHPLSHMHTLTQNWDHNFVSFTPAKSYKLCTYLSEHLHIYPVGKLLAVELLGSA